MDEEKLALNASYAARGLDYCHFCGLKFNVG
jgi:hypothetical protein